MPALQSDIVPALRAVTIVSWADPAIKARYPNARDGSAEAADGYFDSATDAQAAINARGALIGVERRRFVVKVDDLLWLEPAAGLPTVQLIDTDQSIDAACIVSRVEIDLDAETTTLELFG